MSNPDRLGELRAQALPRIITTLAHDKTFEGRSQAAISLVARRKFDEALNVAQTFHLEHPDEDKDVHMGHLMQPFADIGIPPLECLRIVRELVLNEKPADQ